MTVLHCTHADCRAHTAEELLFFAQTSDPVRRALLQRLAAAAQHKEVRCRRVPRKGAVLAPFPGEDL